MRGIIVTKRSSTKASSGGAGTKPSDIRRGGWLNAAIDTLRGELRSIDKSIAVLTKLSEVRRAEAAVEMRPRLVTVKRTRKARSRAVK